MRLMEMSHAWPCAREAFVLRLEEAKAKGHVNEDDQTVVGVHKLRADCALGLCIESIRMIITHPI